MADQFDIVDIVYDAVEPVSTSFILYKDRSGDGETKNHITIRMLTLNETEVVNKGSLMKGVTGKVKSALRNITPPFGMYWKSRIVWSEPLGEAKEGFDCTNIRFEVITEID